MRQIRVDTGWFDGRWEGVDQRQDIRRQWERLLHRAGFLDEQERAFLETTAEQGGRITRLARLTGRSSASVRRQVRDIARRLLGRELDAMLQRPEDFSALEKSCLRDHLIRKRPLACVAEGLGISVYHVRKTLAAARGKVQRLNTEQKNEKDRVLRK